MLREGCLNRACWCGLRNGKMLIRSYASEPTAAAPAWVAFIRQQQASAFTFTVLVNRGASSDHDMCSSWAFERVMEASDLEEHVRWHWCLGVTVLTSHARCWLRSTSWACRSTCLRSWTCCWCVLNALLGHLAVALVASSVCMMMMMADNAGNARKRRDPSQDGHARRHADGFAGTDLQVQRHDLSQGHHGAAVGSHQPSTASPVAADGAPWVAQQARIEPSATGGATLLGEGNNSSDDRHGA